MPEWLSFAGLVTLLLAFMAGVAKLSRWSGQVDTDRSNFKNFIKEIRSDIKEIRSDMKEMSAAISGILGRLSPRVLAESSPLRLTKYGRKVAKDSGMDKLSRKVAPRILGKVRKFEPFEIHEYCSEYVKKLTGQEQVKISRGSYDVGLPKEDMEAILGVLLRDELLRMLEEGPESEES